MTKGRHASVEIFNVNGQKEPGTAAFLEEAAKIWTNRQPTQADKIVAGNPTVPGSSPDSVEKAVQNIIEKYQQKQPQSAVAENQNRAIQKESAVQPKSDAKSEVASEQKGLAPYHANAAGNDAAAAKQPVVGGSSGERGSAASEKSESRRAVSSSTSASEQQLQQSPSRQTQQEQQQQQNWERAVAGAHAASQAAQSQRSAETTTLKQNCDARVEPNAISNQNTRMSQPIAYAKESISSGTVTVVPFRADNENKKSANVESKTFDSIGKVEAAAKGAYQPGSDAVSVSLAKQTVGELPKERTSATNVAHNELSVKSEVAPKTDNCELRKPEPRNSELITKNETKLDAPKSELKADAKLDTKSETTKAESATKSQGEISTKTDAKAEVKADAKIEAKADARNEVRTEPKSETKIEVKSDQKAEGKTDQRVDTKIDSKQIDADASAKTTRTPQSGQMSQGTQLPDGRQNMVEGRPIDARGERIVGSDVRAPRRDDGKVPGDGVTASVSAELRGIAGALVSIPGKIAQVVGDTPAVVSTVLSGAVRDGDVRGVLNAALAGRRVAPELDINLAVKLSETSMKHTVIDTIGKIEQRKIDTTSMEGARLVGVARQVGIDRLGELRVRLQESENGKPPRFTDCDEKSRSDFQRILKQIVEFEAATKTKNQMQSKTNPQETKNSEVKTAQHAEPTAMAAGRAIQESSSKRSEQSQQSEQPETNERRNQINQKDNLTERRARMLGMCVGCKSVATSELICLQCREDATRGKRTERKPSTAKDIASKNMSAGEIVIADVPKLSQKPWQDMGTQNPVRALLSGITRGQEVVALGAEK